MKPEPDMEVRVRKETLVYALRWLEAQWGGMPVQVRTKEGAPLGATIEALKQALWEGPEVDHVVAKKTEAQFPPIPVRFVYPNGRTRLVDLRRVPPVNEVVRLKGKWFWVLSHSLRKSRKKASPGFVTVLKLKAVDSPVVS